MSIASDLRGYADDALEQGRKVVDQVVGQARTQARDTQAQLNDVTGQANEFVGKFTDTAKDNVSGLRSKAASTAADLRAQAEKTIDLSAITNAVEPYVAQARGYAESVINTISAQADSLLATARKDKRVAALLDSAESLTGVVVETVQERVVKPVQQLLGTATPKRKPASATQPATSRRARKPARKPAATASASTSPVKSTAKSTATRARSTAKKAASKA